mgnify:CR=1 FL=1
MKKVPNWIILSILLIACIGFFDTVYLTTNHYRGTVAPCFITGGCDRVTTSVYSVIAGVPVAVLGMLFYFSILLLSAWYIQKEDMRAFKGLTLLSYIGFGMSLWFIYVQANIIGAWCVYCLLSATTSTLIFILANVGCWKKKEERIEENEK